MSSTPYKNRSSDDVPFLGISGEADGSAEARRSREEGAIVSSSNYPRLSRHVWRFNRRGYFNAFCSVACAYIALSRVANGKPPTSAVFGMVMAILNAAIVISHVRRVEIEPMMPKWKDGDPK